MAINIFEGGRRISKLVAVIWIIGWSVGAYYTYESAKPTVNVTYKITGFKEAPIRIMEECPPDSIMNYVDMKTKSGTKVLVKLCREKPKISELIFSFQLQLPKSFCPLICQHHDQEMMQ